MRKRAPTGLRPFRSGEVAFLHAEVRHTEAGRFLFDCAKLPKSRHNHGSSSASRPLVRLPAALVDLGPLSASRSNQHEAFVWML